MKRVFMAAAAALLFGCGGGSGDGEGEVHSYVMSRFNWGTTDPEDPNVAPGFDLDDHATESNDPEGCGKPDFVSPSGDEGIDNQLGALLTLAPRSVIDGIDDAVANGELILLVRISGVDDLTDDESVELELGRGALPDGATAEAVDGELAPGQTFEFVTDEEPVTVSTSIAGGVVEARDFELTFDVPMEDDLMTVDLQGGRVRFAVASSELTDGVLAGSLSVEAAIGAGGALGFSEEEVRPVLESAADMAPDDNGDCTRMSASFVFAGATAEL